MTQISPPLHASDPYVGRRFQGQHGERSILSRQGDSYVLSNPDNPITTLVSAAQIERYIEVEESWARNAQARDKQREAEAAAAQAAPCVPYRVFASTFTPMQGAKVRGALEKLMRRQDQVMPRHAITEQLLQEGGVLSADRTRIQMPGNSFFTPDVLTKTAFDYAAWLSEPVTVWRLEQGGVGPVTSACRPEAPGVCSALLDHLADTNLPTVHDIAGEDAPHWYSGCLSEAELRSYFGPFWDDLCRAGYQIRTYQVPRRALRFAAAEVAFDHRLARPA